MLPAFSRIASALFAKAPAMFRTLFVVISLLVPSLFSSKAQAAVPMVVAGNGYTVALRDDGRVMTWGYDYVGQLDPSLPVLVPGLSDVVAVAIGEVHTLALKADGSVWGWGNNGGGQLGSDTTIAHDSPQPIAGLSQVTAIAAGKCQSVVLKQDGTVWSLGTIKYIWDFPNQRVVKGCQNVAPLAQVSGLSNIVAIAATDDYILAVKQDGTVWALGYLVPGLSNVLTSQLFFQQLPGFTNIKAVAAADDHIVALRQDGTVWTAGINAVGQLGDGTTIERSSAVQMLGLGNVVSIAATRGATLALKEDGSVWWSGAYGFGIGGWWSGDDGFGVGGYRACGMSGYAGNSMWISSPAQYPGLSKIQSIASSRIDGNYCLHHTVALRQDGTVLAWGNNAFGQLGDGTYMDSDAPGYVVNETATGVLSVMPDIPLDKGTLASHYLVTAKTIYNPLPENQNQALSASLTYLPIADYLAKGYLSVGDVLAGPIGDVYFSAFYRNNGTTLHVPASLGANSVKLTGPSVMADPIYSGVIQPGSTWTHGSPHLESQDAIVCIGITFPRLAAKGMVLMRPIYNGANFTPSTLCPTVQTPMTTQLYQGQASGPLTAKTIVAQINPLAEDRGKVMNVYSWAVAPQGSYYHLSMAYMQTSAGWRPMMGAVLPAMTVTVPASGPITLTVADGLDLSKLPGTLFYVGLGNSWEEVKTLNRAGHYYTAE